MTLGWLNGSQLVASFFMLVMAESLQRQSWPFTIFGPLTVLGLIGVVLGDGYLDRRCPPRCWASPPR